MALVETIFDVFSYEAVLSQESKKSSPRRRADAQRIKSKLYYFTFQNFIPISPTKPEIIANTLHETRVKFKNELISKI